jgi:hypothetical protein
MSVTPNPDVEAGHADSSPAFGYPGDGDIALMPTADVGGFLGLGRESMDRGKACRAGPQLAIVLGVELRHL